MLFRASFHFVFGKGCRGIALLYVWSGFRSALCLQFRAIRRTFFSNFAYLRGSWILRGYPRCPQIVFELSFCRPE